MGAATSGEKHDADPLTHLAVYLAGPVPGLLLAMGAFCWLVLGETLGVYVRAALPQQTVIVAPALRELLENPAAKRALWQALHG